MATENTIVLKGMGHHEEGVLDTAATPGMAIELAADGNYDPMVSAQAAAIKGALHIVKEDALQGKTIDDEYAIGDRVFFYTPQRGDHLLVLVKTGEDISVGEYLVVEGTTSGLFVATAGTETTFQVQALESSGGVLASNDHIKVRVV